MQPTRDEVRQKRDELAAKLRDVDRVLGGKSIRETQRLIMDRRRRAERDITIRECADPARRASCEADIYLWLKTYFPDKYTFDFTDDHRDIVSTILETARHGGDQAIAAPRGNGKSAIAEGVLVYCLSLGIIRFALIVGATATEAKRVFDSIRESFELNEILADDYPEVCDPVHLLEGNAMRGRQQTHNGKRTRLVWAASRLVLPTIEGSKASGGSVEYRGIDSAIRGVRIGYVRPDFVLIDDPETSESAASLDQCETREERIERDIAGCGGPGKPLARVILTTIMNHSPCISAIFTDPKQKPSWNGRRHRLLIDKPTNGELWSEYILLRKDGQQAGDRFGRKAMDFLRANWDAMHAGTKVSNPARYNSRLLSDGQPAQLSAVQAYYDFVADKDETAALCELQNDPPEESGPSTSGITAQLVASRMNGLGRRQLPPDCIALTPAIDLGKRECHWVVIAWQSLCRGYVVDYGVVEVQGTEATDHAETIERALVRALLGWKDFLASHPFVDATGQTRPIDRVLVDSGYFANAAYEFIRLAGKPYGVCKGYGGGRYHSGVNSDNRRLGDHWYASRLDNDKVWLNNLDTDYWKSFVHDRFLTQTFDELQFVRPGTLSVWSPADAREHHRYSHHIVSEVYQEHFVEGKGLKRGWVPRSPNNHWLDATCMACAAGNIAGVKMFTEPRAPALVVAPRRPPAMTTPAAQPRTRFLSRPGGWLKGTGR